jgi:hypothetical protein
VEALEAEEVVVVRRSALVEVEAPACVGAALGDDHAPSTLVGDGDLGGHGVGLVLDVDGRVLAEPRHPAEEELGGAMIRGTSWHFPNCAVE